MEPEREFSVGVIGPVQWDYYNDNVDVEVRFPDGRRYTATLFTPENITTLFEKNRATGECAHGLYLWAVEMILVKDLTLGTMHAVVDSLLQSGEFERAFKRASKGPQLLRNEPNS